eukprot:238775-Prorocentrum_minimum.AAC.2
MGCCCSTRAVVEDETWEVPFDPEFVLEFLTDPESYLEIVPTARNLVIYNEDHFSVEGVDTKFFYHFRYITKREVTSSIESGAPPLEYEVSVTREGLTDSRAIDRDRLVSYDVQFEFFTKSNAANMKRSSIRRKVVNFRQHRCNFAPLYMVLLRMLGMERDRIAYALTQYELKKKRKE